MTATATADPAARQGGGGDPPTLVGALAGFTAALTYDDLPVEVRTSLRQRMLDIVGLVLASRSLATSDMALTVARAWGAAPDNGPGGAQLMAHPGRLPTAGAAFVNGVLAHSLDFDDTHLPSVLHPSASIVPAALAAGEACGASYHETLAAAAAGYEICVRTGMAGYDRALGNSVFFERGWHATSICGTLACAAVAGKIFGLDADGIADALGIAASMGAGIIEANRAGGSVKRLHCGWAAHAGVAAAQLAQAGITGPPTALEGRFGFYQAYLGGSMVAEEITEGLGEQWCIPGIFYKPYPANHFTHAGIDAARRLRQRIEHVDDIASMTLKVAAAPHRTIGQPRDQKVRPQSGYHAQFSGPFTVAAALLGGGGLGLWLDDFTDEKARDPRYLALAAKVDCVPDAECDAIFPNQFPAILEATLRDGRRLEERVLVNRGGPDDPLSEDELRIKFRANAERTLDAGAAEALAQRMLDPSDGPAAAVLAPAQQALIGEG